MKKKWLGVVIAVSLILGLIAVPLSGCPAPTTPTPTTPTPTTPTPTTPTPTVEKPTYNWRLASVTPEKENPNYIAAQTFCDLANELSEGRIVIDHYPGELIGDYIFCTEQVSAGTLDFNVSVAPTILDPRLSIGSLGYVVFDEEGARQAFGPGGWAVETCSEIAEAVNWKLLGISPESWNGFMGKIEFTPHPDAVRAQGVTTRVMAMETDKLVAEACGFSPVVIPWSELYMSLVTGVVDLASGQLPAGGTVAMFDDALQPQAYYYNYKYAFTYYWIIMNPDLWNVLSAEDQQILVEAAAGSADNNWVVLETGEETFGRDTEEAGWIVVELTPEQMAANVTAVRDLQWVYLDTVMGTVLMDMIRANAQTPPGG